MTYSRYTVARSLIACSYRLFWITYSRYTVARSLVTCSYRLFWIKQHLYIVREGRTYSILHERDRKISGENFHKHLPCSMVRCAPHPLPAGHSVYLRLRNAMQAALYPVQCPTIARRSSLTGDTLLCPCIVSSLSPLFSLMF